MTTWGPKAASMTQEERDRYMRGVEWEVEHGHASRVECIDGVVIRGFNTKTMRRTLEIHWSQIPARIGDEVRRLKSAARRVWNRRVLGLKNPYRS